jgi:hypothetical protein
MPGVAHKRRLAHFGINGDPQVLANLSEVTRPGLVVTPLLFKLPV